jgi:hypothetical protein
MLKQKAVLNWAAFALSETILLESTQLLLDDGTEADPEHSGRVRLGTGRHVAFARSSDGFNFQKEPQPVYHNTGAVDVAHSGWENGNFRRGS